MMKYPKEYLDEIKLRLKVSQVVGKIVKLKKAKMNTSSKKTQRNKLELY